VRGPSTWLLSASAILIAACSPPEPTTALNRLDDASGSAEAKWATVVLDARQRQQVLEVFQSLPEGEVGPGPRSEPQGRWTDLPDAVGDACEDVETAVVETRFLPKGASLEDAESIEFEIITAGNEPGLVTITRGTPPKLYEAKARIGLLLPQTRKQEMLLEAIAREVHEWGLKPQLEPWPTPSEPGAAAPTAPAPDRPSP